MICEGLNNGEKLSQFTLVRPNTSKARRLVAPIQSGFRPDVQGLRAFAVAAVILAHVTGWPSGGFVGVDVFFVISGFLITGLLLREYDKTGTISFTGFYKRRAKRILPASIAVLIATVAAASLLLPKTRANDTLLDAVWSFFFAGNWRYAATGTDYFQEGTAPSPLQHFWSLSVEEQFYFIWPWLLLAVFALTPRAAGSSRRRMVAGALMVALGIASFAWAMWETNNNPTVAYFSTLTRTWELGVGALIAVATPLLTRIPMALRSILAWVGVAGLIGSLFIINPETSFPAPWALLPVLATGLIISAGTGGEAKYLWPLTNRGSRYIGDLSYSLYLWHWPVAILLVAVLESGTTAYYVFALALILTLSIASYHFVENPIRHWGADTKDKRRQVERRRNSLSAGMVVLTLVTVILVGAGMKVDSDRHNMPVTTMPVAAPLASDSPTMKPCRGANALVFGADCNPGIMPKDITPSIDELSADQGNGYDCWIAEGAEEMRSCSYGSDSEKSLKVALVGDSHAASLIPALTAEIDSTNWVLDTFVGNGCQWRIIAPENKNCGTAMQQIQAKLTEGEPYDVVLTTASRAKFGSDYSRAVQSSQEAWQPVIDRGTRVVVVADPPAVDAAMIECMTRVGFDPATTDCSIPQNIAFSQPDAMVDAAKALGVSVVDNTDLLCLDSKCPAVIGGVIVYKDSASHLTATYARTMSPYVTQRIQDAIGPLK